MNVVHLLVLLGLLNVAAAAGVYLKQANSDHPDRSPFVWFLIVLLFGVLGFLLYVALAPPGGPLLRPITDDEIAEWEEARGN